MRLLIIMLLCLGCGHRDGLVHGAGDPPAVPPDLTNEEVQKWFGTVDLDQDVVIYKDVVFEESAKKDKFLQCGYNPEGPSAKVFNESLVSDSVVRGANWEVSVHGVMKIDATSTGTLIGNAFTVQSAKPEAVKVQADATASAYSNVATFVTVTNAEAQAVLGSKDKSSCGVFMTKMVRMIMNGDKYVNVTFDKPLPYMVIPILTKARAAYEIGGGLTITNITATMGPNSMDLAGTTRTGAVRINMINPTKTFTDSAGKSQTVTADYAVRIVTQFSGAGGDALIWLNSISEYFVSVKTGSFSSFVERVPRKELGLIYYTQQ